MVDRELAHEFRKARAWQAEIANSGGGTLTTFFDSKRTELTFASAPFGKHALSAMATARRMVFFRAERVRMARETEKRSKAARKGWKARREGGR